MNKENNWRERFKHFKEVFSCAVDYDKRLERHIEETIKEERLKWEEETEKRINLMIIHSAETLFKRENQIKNNLLEKIEEVETGNFKGQKVMLKEDVIEIIKKQ